jgi:ABC-type transport system involved in multi-copper enzyme maturation permease subunit
MTKLLEWLLGVGIFLGTWVAIISTLIKAQLLEEWMSVIIPLPLFLLALFGVSIVVLCHSQG